MKHQEHIIALPTTVLPSYDGGVWIQPGDAFNGANIVIAQRAKLEKDPSFRQIIPYAVMKCGDRYAVYRRTEKGNEARLHDKQSMGFGGHIDFADVVADGSVIDLTKTIQEAARREIEEEIELIDNEVVSIETYPYMIASSRSEVDSVHLAVVMVVELKNEQLKAAEDQLEILGFASLNELADNQYLESWSELFVNRMIKGF